MQHAAHGRLLADLHVRDDFVVLQHALDQQLDLAAAGLFAKDARLDHLGVVEDQQVAGLQQIGQLVEAAVHQGGFTRIQQAGSTALGSRVLGNQGFGQFEIEIAQLKSAAGTGEGSHSWLMQAEHTCSSQGSKQGGDCATVAEAQQAARAWALWWWPPTCFGSWLAIVARCNVFAT